MGTPAPLTLAAAALSVLPAGRAAAESLQVELTHPTSGQRLAVAMREPPRFATLRGQQARRWANPRGGGGGGAEGAAPAVGQ